MLVVYFLTLIICLVLCNFELNAVPLQRIELKVNLNNTRRIMGGKEVGETRPYMVYLRAAPSPRGTKSKKPDWLCGGVIIHEKYVLTSAACIEDVQQFYIVSGTHTWVPGSEENECIQNGAKKAVWKCVPKSYIFDGKDFENVLWMANDIAVVKVEDDFNFKKRVRGCDFIPQKIAFNNISEELEKPGTYGSIAGWGSIDKYITDEPATGRKEESNNSPALLETEVVLLSKKNCKKRWDPRYHHIIEEHMICAKDGSDLNAMSELCMEQDINCKELVYSDEDGNNEETRRVFEPSKLVLHDSKHTYEDDTRRTGANVGIGGFCENDHGGPLVVGQGKGAVVVGVISACMTKEITRKCYGPFLYTSVWKNRNLINCAIHKDMGRVKPVKNVSVAENAGSTVKRGREKKDRRNQRRMIKKKLKADRRTSRK